jgi:Holliday junction resolvasome RuvABC endonuclease subunit
VRVFGLDPGVDYVGCAYRSVFCGEVMMSKLLTSPEGVIAEDRLKYLVDSVHYMVNTTKSNVVVIEDDGLGK